jgi:hypothetical protein
VNVVVLIDGREAVPVRAIPLLTNWETMSPDIVARALAWDEDSIRFEGLQAFHYDNRPRALPATWWENVACRKLRALRDSIKAAELTHETGLQEWRQKSIEVLPAGVFVWRDEFEPMHCRRYGPEGTTLLKNGVQVSGAEHERLVALDFDPYIQDPEFQRQVMEGFEQVVDPSSHHLAQLHFVRGFCGAGNNDEHWLGLNSLTPREAAELLCGRDPEVPAIGDEQRVARLERRLTDHNESHPARRSWREWHRVAMEICADYEKGFDKLFAEMGHTPNIPIVDAPTQTQDAAPVLASNERVTYSQSVARRNLLTPVIEAAQKECGNPSDAAAVWAVLMQMARTPKLPLLGLTDDGIKWQDPNDEPKFFTIKNLRDRLRRTRSSASKAR